MSFKDQPWNARFQSMGDQAEAVFEEIAPLGPFDRLGWNKTRVSMKNMHQHVRYLPDYYASEGVFVEVQGCGRDHTVKIKVEKAESMEWWSEQLHPVVLFLWNSDLKEWALVGPAALRLLLDGAEVRSFPEGKEYYAIPWDAVPGRTAVDVD